MLPIVIGIGLVRPAAADVVVTSPFSRFALTTSGAAVTSSGTVDAGGGLVNTDAGAATVTGRLDNGPSSKATAVAVQPGSTISTLSNSSGGPAVPEAMSQYPGGPATNTETTAGTNTTDAGMLSADANSSAATSATGSAATASEKLVTDAAGDKFSATVTANSGSLTLGGVLTIGAVVGTASVSYDSTGRHSTASLTVSGASVGGIPVTIDSTGVHVAGTTVGTGVVPGVSLAQSVSDSLSGAGISVSAIDPTMTTTANSAYADTGALVINETTPDLTSTITTLSSASTVTIYLGSATATESDAVALPQQTFDSTTFAPTASPTTSPTAAPTSVAPVVAQPTQSYVAPVAGTPAVPGHPVTTVVAGNQPNTAVVAAPQPDVAAATVPSVVAAAPASYDILGHRLGKAAAVAGFGAWQLLTLGLASTAAVLSRRREAEEAHLCPCP
jgi:hypothetical protein